MGVRWGHAVVGSDSGQCFKMCSAINLAVVHLVWVINRAEC